MLLPDSGQKAERMFPLIPRSTDRWSKLYKGRAAVEREFGHPSRYSGPTRAGRLQPA
jgi:hypothetical protein